MTRSESATAADLRIRPWVAETRCLASPEFSSLAGCRVSFKEEQQQHTGSFKLRGAFNKLLTLTPDDRERGIVAASSGNHGAAVSYAAAALGITARVFVPQGASPAKVAKIRAKGAKVVFFGTDGLDTELEARRVAGESGAVYVSPYNDLDVMAGQGTVAVELLRQEPDVSRVYIAVGGGGLIGGMASYLAAAAPHVRVVGAVPTNSPVMAESVKAGRIVQLESLPTLSDGTAGGIEEGAITFDVCRTLVNRWVTVSEDEIVDAMRAWARVHEGVIEGAAGVAIAALLRDAGSLRGETVAVVICGGNTSAETWNQVVAATDR